MLFLELFQITHKCLGIIIILVLINVMHKPYTSKILSAMVLIWFKTGVDLTQTTLVIRIIVALLQVQTQLCKERNITK